MTLSAILPSRGYSLGEVFNEYNAPQALALGNAWDADSNGYLALYYNPAGLAKYHKKKFEIAPLDATVIGGMAGMGPAWSAQGFGVSQLTNPLLHSPNQYAFYSMALMPSVRIGSFAISFLSSYQSASVSDGSNLETNTFQDEGVTVGKGFNFFHRLLKVGVDARAIDRNQLNGTFAPGVLGASQVGSQMQEGLGIGGDVGVMATLPNKFLPTLGFVWHNMGDTSFQSSHFLNSKSTGTPMMIPQSFNAAFSIHPHLGNHWDGTLSVEMQNIEQSSWGLERRMHMGLQLANHHGFYLWLGLNEIYPTGGVALHLPGGALEVGSYAENIAYGPQLLGDRRFMVRYTISF